MGERNRGGKEGEPGPDEGLHGEQTREKNSQNTSASVEPGPQEVFCTSCGEIIKERAVICPECGVRQRGAEIQHGESAIHSQHEAGYNRDHQRSLSDARVRELQRIARKDKGITMLVGFLLSPIGYVLVGKWGLAILNFLTLNYLLFGLIIVPLHTKSIIENARDELEAEGYSW